MEDRKAGIQCLIIGTAGFVPLTAAFCFETIRNRYVNTGGLSMVQIALLIFACMSLAMCVFGAGELYGYYTKKRDSGVSRAKPVPTSDLAKRAGGTELIWQYHSLLECGAITQGEYDEIKKRLLKGQVKEAMYKKPAGLICFFLGLVGCIYSFWTIQSDMDDVLEFLVKGYDYQPPFTFHETAILAVLIISIIILVVGISLLLLLLPDWDEQKAEDTAGDLDDTEIIEKIKTQKELLDNSIITQEEYNKIMTRLLHLH